MSKVLRVSWRPRLPCHRSCLQAAPVGMVGLAPAPVACMCEAGLHHVPQVAPRPALLLQCMPPGQPPAWASSPSGLLAAWAALPAWEPPLLSWPSFLRPWRWLPGWGLPACRRTGGGRRCVAAGTLRVLLLPRPHLPRPFLWVVVSEAVPSLLCGSSCGCLTA